MAFGTGPVPRVDKITGPGNIYVTLAKKEVYGYVDIDMIAGPSEIVVVADKSANQGMWLRIYCPRQSTIPWLHLFLSPTMRNCLKA